MGKMEKIKQIKARGYVVVNYDECTGDEIVISHHRVYDRALLMAEKTGYHVEAIINHNTQKQVINVKGKIPNNMVPLVDRYVDDTGNQFVQCYDNHFETIENVDKTGFLISYYLTPCVYK